MILPVIEAAPTRWRILAEFYPNFGIVSGGIYVEQKRNLHDSITYGVVLRDSWELSKSGEWDDRPMPSNRSDDYLMTHRWSSLDEAIKAAQVAAKKLLDEK